MGGREWWWVDEGAGGYVRVLVDGREWWWMGEGAGG